MIKSREELEAENEQLRADLETARWRQQQHQLAGRPLVRQSPFRERVELPTAEQKLELSRIVIADHPWLSSASVFIPPSEWDAMYVAAFDSVAHVDRTDKPDTRYYLSHWIDKVTDISRALGHHVQITKAPLIAAALSWGDISHNATDDSNPGFVICLGLCDGTGRKANSEAWKRLLHTRKLVAPTSDALPKRNENPEYLANRPRVTVYKSG